MDRKLLASVVVPVYNKEAYLDACCRSLSKQAIDHDSLEVIFVNDGSVDRSAEILKTIEAEHAWANVITQKNSGVCAARNAGITAARGKFIFFLDPDDELSSNTICDVVAFFQEHYDEVDLVTYPIVSVSGGETQAPHPRYQILKESGVYDLRDRDSYQICQTTMNVCVKNEFEENTLFRFRSSNGKIFHEDQAYITDVLLKKMKLGFCESAAYLWKRNADSVSDELINPYNLFENTTSMYEELFSRFDGDVPRYVQGLLANDIGWKMRRDALLPSHLKGERYRRAVGRLAALVDRVDNEVLLRHSNMHLYHSLYFIGLKPNKPIRALVGPDALALHQANEVVWSGSKVEVMLLRTRTIDQGINLIGFIKSPLFLFYDGVVSLHAVWCRGSDRTREPIELTPSSWSRCGCERTETACFYDFRYRIDFDDVADISFEVCFGGIPVKTFVSLFPKTNFSRELGNTIVDGDFSVSLVRNATVLRIDRIRGGELKEIKSRQMRGLALDVRLFRQIVFGIKEWKSRHGSKIWIYTDSVGKTDNAWIQFLHDAKKDDGVYRYYAAQEVCCTLENGKHAKVIPFGGRKHKVLFVAADKLLCSDAAQASTTPFGPKARRHYADLINAEMIYLQHGVLWAHLPWYYSFDRILFDREVVSTRFEAGNLISNYGFRETDLIKSGMPRYDEIPCEARPQKKILLCPSWRGYLIGALTSGGRTPLRDKFERSDYYRGLMAFLNNKRLISILESSGYDLHLKLHPLFECYKNLFVFKSEKISFAPDEVHEAEYAAAITDYSSYSFDFVYLGRALIYFIPDEEMFSKGMNHYSELDIPLEEAFGEYVHSADEAVGAVERIIDAGGIPLPKFAERQKGLFFHRDNNQAERLYRALIEDGRELEKRADR